MSDPLRDAIDAIVKERLGPLSVALADLNNEATSQRVVVKRLESESYLAKGADEQHLAAANRAQATHDSLLREVGALNVEIRALAVRLTAAEKHDHPELEGRIEGVKRLTSTLGNLLEFQKRGALSPVGDGTPSKKKYPDGTPSKKKYPLEGFVRCEECGTIWDLEMWRSGLGNATIGTVTCLTKDCKSQFRLPTDILDV